MGTKRTLGEFVSDGGHLAAYCDNPSCRHGQEMDMQRLVRLLGADFEMAPGALQRVLYCPLCNGDSISIISDNDRTRRHVGSHSAESGSKRKPAGH